jgi:hypothetical protein
VFNEPSNLFILPFQEAFNKAYADEAEEGNRREIWELNYDKIQQHNADFQQGLHTYSLGENSYADLVNFLLLNHKK